MRLSSSALLVLATCTTTCAFVPHLAACYTNANTNTNTNTKPSFGLTLANANEMDKVSVSFHRKETYQTHPRPENDLMIRAAFGEIVERTPVWLFRQAGRHLPEYRAYKEETKHNFLEMLEYPEVSERVIEMPLCYDNL